MGLLCRLTCREPPRENEPDFSKKEGGDRAAADRGGGAQTYLSIHSAICSA